MKFLLELAAAHYGVISGFVVGYFAKNTIVATYTKIKAKLSTVKL